MIRIFEVRGRIYDININNPTTTSIRSTLSAGRPNAGNSGIDSTKGRFATAQNEYEKGVQMFDTMTEALLAIGIAALVAAAAAAAIGGYFLYRWMKHMHATDKIASTT